MFANPKNFGRIFLFLVSLLSSCGQLYQGKNLDILSYPIETHLRSQLISDYFDTLIQNRGYQVPDKWMHKNKLVILDSINFKRIYLKNNPEEMYLVSFQGMLLLADVYNPNIVEYDWVANRERMPKEEEDRIKKRFKTEILDTIEAIAKRDGLQDSIIYKQ